jgi:serine/threonine protein kinase
MTTERPSEPAIDPSAPTLPGRDLAETAAPGAGPAPDAADVPPELRDHPRYRIVRLLGRGGMGAVYQAVHTVMDRPVALKVMRPDLTENPAAVERFKREVKAAAQLHHPNIVTAFDAEQVGNTHFLVMEYVDGRTLADVVAADGPLPAEVAADFVAQAAQGLQFAFEKGMIHRDIKPHNLMRTGVVISPETAQHPHGQIKILDFGLARLATEGSGAQTASGMILGTVDFMAPEQADNAKKADIRSDIYSLGCTLFYLLTGRVPFPDGSVIQRVMAHVEKEPPSLSELRPRLPGGLTAVVAKMLAKRPADRYQTPAEVAQALAPFRSSSPVSLLTLASAAPALAKARGKTSDTEPMDVIPVGPAPLPRLKRPTPAAEPKPKKGRSLLGCLLIAVLVILSVTGLLAFAIYLIVDRGGRALTEFWQEAVKQQRSWDNIEKSFSPPAADIADEKLFPQKLGERGEFELVGINSSAAAPELNLEQKGRQATYKFAGRGPIELHVFQGIKEPDKESMFQRVIDLVPKEKPGSAKTGVTFVSGGPRTKRLTVHYDRSDGPKPVRIRAQLWYSDTGWLFALSAPTSVNPEPLLTEYLDWLINNLK